MKEDAMMKYRSYGVSASACNGKESKSIFTMSPSQTAFSIYIPLCGKQEKSYCYDNTSREIFSVMTSDVQGKHSCK
jgi:hypothetical protein